MNGLKSSAKKVKLASVDDLFSTEESRQDAALEKVQHIALSEFHPFPDHPFSVKADDSMKPFKPQYLPRQISVRLRNLTATVVGVYTLALHAAFLCPDRAGDLGAENIDLAAVSLAQKGGDLFRKVRAAVHHRQQDTINLELGVDLPPYFANRL